MDEEREEGLYTYVWGYDVVLGAPRRGKEGRWLPRNEHAGRRSWARRYGGND